MKNYFIITMMLLVCVGCDQARDKQPSTQNTKPTMAMQGVDKPSNSVSKQSSLEGIDYYQKGMEFLESGQVEKAATQFYESIKINPQDSKAYLILGKIFINTNNQEQAQQMLTMAIRLDSTRADTYLLLAQSYETEGRLDEAIESVKKSVLLYKQQEDQSGYQQAVAVLQMLMSKKEAETPNEN